MSDRREARRQLGRAAVLSEAEAVALLPCRDSTAREWLREEGLVRLHPKLGRIVVWEDVLAALRTRPLEEPIPGPPSGLRRAGL